MNDGESPKTTHGTSLHLCCQIFVQQLLSVYVGLIGVISKTIHNILVHLRPLLRHEHLLGTCRMRLMLWILAVSCIRVKATNGDPTGQPSMQPSQHPSTQPSIHPSRQPTRIPSRQPTSNPSNQPSIQPSSRPSHQPSSRPSHQPSSRPTHQPSSRPSEQVGEKYFDHIICITSL